MFSDFWVGHYLFLKGLTMIFAGQEKPIYGFQKEGNIYIYLKKKKKSP